MDTEAMGFAVVHQRCCALDVHSKSLTACALTPEGEVSRRFGTMLEDLEELASWLEECQIRVVAMESTGVYWVPVYNVLEEGRGRDELLVVNAAHVKALRGRKTDLKDAQWLARLLRYGQLRGSRIPNREQRELRELVRHRTTLVGQRAQLLNRVHKLLEGANIKLGSVASDIAGVSGMEMLEQLASGDQDPARLAGLARGRMRSKQEQLTKALTGKVRQHHRFMLASMLRQIEFLSEEIAAMDGEVEERMRPFQAALDALDKVPGIGQRGAQCIIAELGVDMSPWSSHQHLASWAKLCPGNNQSGGKRRRAPTGRGNRWLRQAVIEAARAAVRAKDSYLGAQYRRLKGRGPGDDGRAIVAVAHTILIIVYHLLKDGSIYQDLGKDYFRQRDREHTVRRALHSLQSLGFKVTLEEGAVA
jgi:transposase